ncbi:MAG: class I SAM-dependent methyltransferase [Bacteroidales bacterium]|nr:class I SAM-dependent methyltransferase [Bacteroidales bacterium]
MPQDKSLFFYGSFFHRFLDPQLAENRQVTVDFIPEDSSVLDIACGTGQLCFELRKIKHCRVIGLDLSLRMLDFARKTNPFQDITFVYEDATDLHIFEDNSFDFATMLMIMHELQRPQQISVIKEALRVARRGIIIDSVVPLPKNVGGIGYRFVEATIGHDHYPNFKAFLAGGGIGGILKESGLPVNIEYSSVFWRRCREMVVVSVQR